MTSKEPGYGEGVTQEEYDQKLSDLQRRQSKGGNQSKDFSEKFEMWVQDDASELDMEYQAEFTDWPIARVREIHEELPELEESDEERES